MPEILYRFRRVCPETDVDLRLVDHELEPFELLEEGRTDVIFAARQSHINCDWTPLYYDAMYAILPEDYPTGSEETFPIEEFDGKEFLMPYGRFDIDVNAALSPKKVKPNIRPCHVDDETVIRMVSKGLGITMMTEIMMRGRTHGVKTLPVSPKTGRELGIGMHLSKNTPEEILRLRECVQRQAAVRRPKTLPHRARRAPRPLCGRPACRRVAAGDGRYFPAERREHGVLRARRPPITPICATCGGTPHQIQQIRIKRKWRKKLWLRAIWIRTS